MAIPSLSFAQMALPGYTGLLNAPNARTLVEGQFEAGLNNTLDPRYTSSDIATPRSYLLDLGLYRGLEVGGRITEYQTSAGAIGIRDLSANFKWRLPIPWEHGPDIAIGMTDLTGGAQNFRAKYLVATKRFGPIDFSVGVGSGQRLNGVFGGAELALPYGFSILADHEPTRTAAGVRWRSEPIKWLADSRIVVSALRQGAAGNDAPARSEAQFSIVIPLGKAAASAPATAAAKSDVVQHPPAVQSGLGRAAVVAPEDRSQGRSNAKPTEAGGPGQGQPRYISPPSIAPLTVAQAQARQTEVVAAERERRAKTMAVLATLKERLITAGLREVYVGVGRGSLEIRFENTEFTRSDMDGVGVALGEAASRAPADIDRIGVTIVRRGVPAWRVTTNAANWRSYLGTDTGPGGQPPAIDVSVGEDVPNGVDWESYAPGAAQPRLQLAVGPYLRTFVANEVGLLSYAWGANVQPVVPLWRGGTFAMEFLVPIANSSNFDEGQPFSPFRPRGGLQSAMVSHTAWLGSRWLTQTGVGRVQHEYNGVSHESMLWPLANGDIGLRLRAGVFTKGADRSDRREYAVAGARAYVKQLDTFFEVSAGRYWAGDTGGSIEAKRWFGDVSVALYAQQTAAKVAGVRISFPIAPGRSRGGEKLQFKAADRFEHSLSTTLGSTNAVTPNAALVPTPAYNLQQSMLDNGRTSPGYLQLNAPRLRDAWWRYRPIEGE